MAELGPSQPGASVEAVREDDVVVFRLTGTLDVVSSPAVSAAIGEALAVPAERAIFDLSDLTFMDSSGIAVLLTAAQRLRVQVRRPSPIIRQVIELTGLGEALPIAE
jgi:anti-anti-sigma factor